MTKLFIFLIIWYFLLFPIKNYAQNDSLNKNLELSNLKMSLLESRLLLLESSLNNVSNLPNLLTDRVFELEDRVVTIDEHLNKMHKQIYVFPDTICPVQFNSSIKLDFIRLMESSFKIA